ncbi:MAG TPA: hypothetical protein DCK98_15770 [Chloroflexi bacterium]|nr:hypothetical protein [Chloroflexota bacterium]HAL26824.1 hypothetical protein [Chloroflexota bacterium]
MQPWHDAIVPAADRVLRAADADRDRNAQELVGAGGASVAALLQIAASAEVQAAETIIPGLVLLLTLWTLAMGVLMWRWPAADLARNLPWRSLSRSPSRGSDCSRTTSSRFRLRR